MRPLKLAVLASGGGSNLLAILEAIDRKELAAEIAAVISNNENSGALQKAKAAGVPAYHLSLKTTGSQHNLDRNFQELFDKHEIDLIVLAGYMKMISPEIISKYKNRILNIHPALLPSFGGKGMYGINVHKAVLEYGCKVSGVTVHLVDDDYDSGAPVLQACVPVKSSDTPETLAARVLKKEHQVYTEAIRLFAEKKVKIEGRKVYIEDEN